MTDVQPFDPAALQKRISENIRTQFAALIPDDAFAELVRKNITEFFETPVSFEFKEIYDNQNGYRTTKYVMENALTPFQAMLWSELQDMVRMKLHEWVAAQKGALEAQIKDIFEKDAVLPATFNLSVTQLAEKLARNAHMHIIQEAAAQAGYQYSEIKFRVDQITARVGL
jgi:hypothetical protein